MISGLKNQREAAAIWEPDRLFNKEIGVIP